MMQITATFTLFGYKTREVDLTPILGVSIIVIVIFLVGKTTMGV